MPRRTFGWPNADTNAEVAADLAGEPTAAERATFVRRRDTDARVKYGGASYFEAEAILQFLVWGAGSDPRKVM